MHTDQAFRDAYAKLNPAQKTAVDSIDGPVMVVAGPGTGKTQVLSLRIANIISSDAQVKPGEVLCLTFTNAGVRAMRERLLALIGSTASEVYISTFHRFAIGIIEKYFSLIGFETKPELLSDTEAVALVDEILQAGEWQHIRPRSDAARYFGDLKSLVSLLKRESLSPEQFLEAVELDIARISDDPANISSRGARKGELKMEALKDIEALERTREVVRFYEAYEAAKQDRALMDYDDALAYAVRLAEISEEVRADLREAYQYVLVDEHQDSSGVQNAFLRAVWSSTEKPNIFVVGDDRQLIYGFAGSSLAHFTDFRGMFGAAKEITLTENYRSTQTVLDAADTLLESTIAKGKLHANSHAPETKLRVLECGYPRDEILLAAKDIAEKLAAGAAPEDCAILVPKNYQVRSAVAVLRDQGIPVAASGTVSFFSSPETKTVRDILHAVHDPYDAVALSALMLDPAVGIPPLAAHRFLREQGARKLSLEALAAYGGSRLPTDPVARLGVILSDLLTASGTLGLHGLMQAIGEKLFFAEPREHETLIRQVEVIRTFMHLAEAQLERHPHLSLGDFLLYLDRLEAYGHELPLAVFSADRGVRVLTLHGSKGLEFAHVYIAHLDDASLMRGKRLGFTLPESLETLVEKKDETVARRELYVAITRAKETCTLSYPRRAYAGGELEPARILADLPEALVERRTLAETEAALLADDPMIFVSRAEPVASASKEELAAVVAEEYPRVNVSVTLLNNFFECPWKWYFRNLLQLPEPKTESLLLGSAVHAGIEYMIKSRDARPHDATLRDAIAREYVRDETLSERIFRDAKKILASFAETHLPHISEDAVSERSVSYKDAKLPHLTLYGKIDLTEREEDRVVAVTDFKTGSPKGKSVIEKPEGEEGRMSGLLRQLAMYSYIIEGAEKGTEVRASKLLFIEAKPGDKDAVYERSIGGEEIGRLKADIADYDRLVRSGEWTGRPCEAKLYGSSRECEYCARAKLLYGAQ